jgi:hypothetical protein
MWRLPLANSKNWRSQAVNATPGVPPIVFAAPPASLAAAEELGHAPAGSA